MLRLKKRSRLETIKTVVEIIAIVVAGGWAVFEYGVRQYEERQEGVGLRRLNVDLKGDVSVHGDVAWVLGKLKLTNPSRRVVRTSIVTWWWDSLDPRTRIEHTEKIQNSSAKMELAPTEESFNFQRFVIPMKFRSIILHVHVFSSGDDDKTECRAVDAPDGGIEVMKNEPTVCLATKGSKECKDVGCDSQQAEVMLPLIDHDGKPDAAVHNSGE
jgi:hypothetical protein